MKALTSPFFLSVFIAKATPGNPILVYTVAIYTTTLSISSLAIYSKSGWFRQVVKSTIDIRRFGKPKYYKVDVVYNLISDITGK